MKEGLSLAEGDFSDLKLCKNTGPYLESSFDLDSRCFEIFVNACNMPLLLV